MSTVAATSAAEPWAIAAIRHCAIDRHRKAKHSQSRSVTMKFGISAVAVADKSLQKIRSTKNSIKQIYLIKREISIAKKIAVYIFFPFTFLPDR
ncbi:MULTISPECIES: hypothetical protein [unclassified Microcoleus]|uniref:hypothetical protein n=1 Tax=unclassified Microcoleus TaxID=2642155 RepID=UPI002FD2DEC0